MKIRPLGAELFHAEGRTDRRTYRQTDMTALIVAFRNFANAPKKLQKYAIWQTNDSLSRRHPLSLEMQASHLDRNIRCPAIQVAMHESLKMTWRNQSMKSDETDLFFSFRISSQFPIQMLLLAARSAHFPQTHWCQRQSAQANQPTSKPSRSSPQAGSRSSSSASSWGFFLRFPTVWSRASYWSWEFSDLKTSWASYILISALGWSEHKRGKIGTTYFWWFM